MQERILPKYAAGMEISSLSPALGAARDEVTHVVAGVCGYSRDHARHLVSLLDQPAPPAEAPPAAAPHSRYADTGRRRRGSLAAVTTRPQEAPVAAPTPEAVPDDAPAGLAPPTAPEAALPPEAAAEPKPARLKTAQARREPRLTAAPPARPGVDVDQVATAPAVPFVPHEVSAPAPAASAGRTPLLDYPAWWCPRSTCHRRQFDPGPCRNCGGDLLKVRIEIHRDHS
ncbi:hypothetical protein [Dactylosporangium salmoneum]